MGQIAKIFTNQIIESNINNFKIEINLLKKMVGIRF